MNLTPMKFLVWREKLSFVSHCMFNKTSLAGKVMMQEVEGDEKFRGLVYEVREFCKKHDLPDPSRTPLDKEFIGESIKEIARKEMWKELVPMRSHNLNLDPNTNFPLYMYRVDMTNMQKWAVFNFKIGSLNFRKRWSGLYKTTDCPYGCRSEDSYQHSLDCRRNPVERPTMEGNCLQLSNYILGMHRDRVEKFGESLLYY